MFIYCSSIQEEHGPLFHLTFPENDVPCMKQADLKIKACDRSITL